MRTNSQVYAIEVPDLRDADQVTMVTDGEVPPGNSTSASLDIVQEPSPGIGRPDDDHGRQLVTHRREQRTSRPNPRERDSGGASARRPKRRWDGLMEEDRFRHVLDPAHTLIS